MGGGDKEAADDVLLSSRRAETIHQPGGGRPVTGNIAAAAAMLATVSQAMGAGFPTYAHGRIRDLVVNLEGRPSAHYGWA